MNRVSNLFSPMLNGVHNTAEGSDGAGIVRNRRVTQGPWAALSKPFKARMIP
jgi:hypothetical protein